MASLYEPPRGICHFSAVANGVHYMWGGTGDDYNFTPNAYTFINCYDPLTEQWDKKLTSGTPHIGRHSGGCASIGNELFCFGGWNGPSRCNDLTKLNLQTMQWSKLSPKNDPKECPMIKNGCGLVAVDETNLCCFGGIGVGPKQPGSTHTIDSQYSNEVGLTNECHIFNTVDGAWSSPGFSGERPPPCCFFAFTKVDQHRAVLFGGYGPVETLMSKVLTLHVFDFTLMSITKVEGVQGQPWPVGRSSLSAPCLNYGGDHPQLLVFGGDDHKSEALRDAWLYDVDAAQWTEVPLSVNGRFHYSLTATSLAPGLSEVLLFGGVQRQMVSNTTILRFECPPGGRQWTLVDVADNSTRASRQRLPEKQDKIRQTTSCSQ